ncbi:MAG TPA: alpha/beta fold hydrolase [Stenotrophomonas sp.]|nr:alpha/beta fold hydrolase [Stenotrophomonas sp.]
MQPFYALTTSDSIGPAGSLIRAEAINADVPAGARAWRLLYASRGVHDEPIAVSALLLAPSSPAPKGGRPLVAWAHPTTGVATQCAPSLARTKFKEIAGLDGLLAQGDVVVATDYPGLGTAGTHPYLVGVSEGRAVLDSVRAARALLKSEASDRYALWGHSQGGHAALYAAELAKTYAPELHLRGVAVAAPATALDILLRDDADSTGGRNITAMTLWSWSRLYDLSLDPVLQPQARKTMDTLARECIESPLDLVERGWSGRPLKQHFLKVADITRASPWNQLLRENTPGLTPPGIPVLIAQGDADNLVRPAVTEAYRDRLCAQGSAVRWLTLPKVGHGFIARDAAPAVVDWLGDRLAGKPVVNDCPAQ